MELVIGTKTWSTWSLRAWLVMKRSGLPFTETLVQLREANGVSEAAIRVHSPSGLVPVLKDGDLTIWDSLAIAEYLAGLTPAMWPLEPPKQALARAATAEMHAGFAALRAECPMDLGAAPKSVALSEATQKDVRRIVALWSGLLDRFGGPFLVEQWSIADAFYTPVATRFRTYGIDPADYGGTRAAQDYCQRLLTTPEFLAWEAQARG
jgi:glutathione S-transferase